MSVYLSGLLRQACPSTGALGTALVASAGWGARGCRSRGVTVPRPAGRGRAGASRESSPATRVTGSG